MRYLRLSAPVLALILVVLPRSSAEASTLGVPQDYPTIQAAIDAAVNGDTVTVAPGTYVENINFHGKAITVASAQGPSQTVIDGGALDSVATFTSGEGSGSVLNGFTLRNGRSDFSTPGFGDGGGIRIQSSSPTIRNNVITANAACNGVGISVRFGSPFIQANTITANVRQGCSGGTGGGGIQVVGAAAAKIIDNVISDNVMTSGDGGGIALFAAGTPTIQGNVISGNTASGLSPCAGGGGISMVNNSDADIIGNLIVGNSAGCGGGIQWLVPSGARGPLLVNNTIADNDGALGSGVYADGFDAGVKFFNNIVVAKAGQTAVLCTISFDPTPPTFQSNDVFAQSGVRYGGGCTDQTGANSNISADPLFIDPAGGNYNLQVSSPVIDVGTNAAPKLPSVDINGDPRVADGDGNGVAVVDIGAVEFSDVVPPETTITSGPTGTIAVNSATFTWTGTDNLTAVGNLTFAYRLHPLEPNFSAFTSATSRTYTGLANGSYTLYVKARDEIGNEDASPASRGFTVTLRPDLVEIAVSNPPATMSAGKKFSVTDTVQNQGGAAASSSSTQYYLSKDRQKGADDVKLSGSHSVPALAPAATHTRTVNVGIPASMAAGAYYLLACADDNTAVTEVNEGNNCLASAATVQVKAR